MTDCIGDYGVGANDWTLNGFTLSKSPVDLILLQSFVVPPRSESPGAVNACPGRK
jgi:hypothetical protein